MENQSIKSQLSICFTLFKFCHDPQRIPLQPPLDLKCCCCGKSIKYQGGKIQLCRCTHWLTASCHCTLFLSLSPKGYAPLHTYSLTFSDHDYFFLNEAEFLFNILFSNPHRKSQRVNKQKIFYLNPNFPLDKKKFMIRKIPCSI